MGAISPAIQSSKRPQHPLHQTPQYVVDIGSSIGRPFWVPQTERPCLLETLHLPCTVLSIRATRYPVRPSSNWYTATPAAARMPTCYACSFPLPCHKHADAPSPLPSQDRQACYGSPASTRQRQLTHVTTPYGITGDQREAGTRRTVQPISRYRPTRQSTNPAAYAPAASPNALHAPMPLCLVSVAVNETLVCFIPILSIYFWSLARCPVAHRPVARPGRQQPSASLYHVLAERLGSSTSCLSRRYPRPSTYVSSPPVSPALPPTCAWRRRLGTRTAAAPPRPASSLKRHLAPPAPPPPPPPCP